MPFNVVDVVIVAIIAFLCVFLTYRLFHDHKGGCSCGGSCSGCTSASCSPDPSKVDPELVEKLKKK